MTAAPAQWLWPRVASIWRPSFHSAGPGALGTISDLRRPRSPRVKKVLWPAQCGRRKQCRAQVALSVAGEMEEEDRKGDGHLSLAPKERAEHTGRTWRGKQ
jgi:hypothetical protein